MALKRLAILVASRSGAGGDVPHLHVTSSKVVIGLVAELGIKADAHIQTPLTNPRV